MFCGWLHYPKHTLDYVNTLNILSNRACNVQTPIFLGFDYTCATYNRGMAQDMNFDRVELAQAHEYSWPTTPYHANTRKSIQHKKMEHKFPDIRTVSINIFRSCFFCPINHVALVCYHQKCSCLKSGEMEIQINPFKIPSFKQIFPDFGGRPGLFSQGKRAHGSCYLYMMGIISCTARALHPL